MLLALLSLFIIFGIIRLIISAVREFMAWLGRGKTVHELAENSSGLIEEEYAEDIRLYVQALDEQRSLKHLGKEIAGEAPRLTAEQRRALRKASYKARREYLDYIKLGWFQIVVIFLVASVLGLIIEEIWMFITEGLTQSRVGLVWGPYSPIYGFGAVLLTIVCWKLRERGAKAWQIFVVGMIVGGLLEQITGWGMETFLGAAVEDFEPNATISTLLGITGDTKGEGQFRQPSAIAALSLIAQKIGEKLNQNLFKAARSENGDTTEELFNGFDTITQAEITANNISTAKGNLIELSEPITKTNAYDLLTEEVLYKLTDEMRAQELYIYCAQSIKDKYDQAYFATHGHVPFYQNYTQNVLEGSEGKIKFVPLVGKAGSEFIHISNKSNMLVGYDQMGDMESVSIEKYAPFILTFVMTMFFGTQFESISPKRLQVVKLAASNAGGENTGGGNTGS